MGAFSVNAAMLLSARVIAGVGAVGMFSLSLVLLVEMMPMKHRTTFGIAINILFALGEALVGVVAIFVRRWRPLQLIISTPAAILLFTYWYIPESLTWLLQQKKYDRAEKLVNRMTEVNKASPIENLELKSQEDSGPADDQQGKNVLDLVRSPVLRAVTLNMFYIWFATNIVYYGTSQNSGNLSGNLFVNFIALMLIEIPSYLCVGLFMDRVGHKTMLFFMMLLASVSCITCGLLSPDSTTPIVVLSLIGKFGGSGCFAIIYVYATEIFPTAYRSVGVGACSMIARISGILSPLVAGIGTTHPRVPLLIFGGLAAISLISCLYQPETVGRPLPQTLKDCEDLVSSQGMFDFLKFCAKAPRDDKEALHPGSEEETKTGSGREGGETREADEAVKA